MQDEDKSSSQIPLLKLAILAKRPASGENPGEGRFTPVPPETFTWRAPSCRAVTELLPGGGGPSRCSQEVASGSAPTPPQSEGRGRAGRRCLQSPGVAANEGPGPQLRIAGQRKPVQVLRCCPREIKPAARSRKGSLPAVSIAR